MAMSMGSVARAVLLLLLGGGVGYIAGTIREDAKLVEYVFDDKFYMEAPIKAPTVSHTPYM